MNPEYLTPNYSEALNAVLLCNCPPHVPFTRNQIVLEQRIGSEYGSALEDRAPTPECPPDTTRLYLDNHEVRKALHIPDFVSRNWTEDTLIPYDREYPCMSSQMKELIDVHKLSSIIVYNGDLDMVCDFIGDQRFVDNLGYRVREPYKAWKVNGRIGGFVKRYEGITFTTVREAGHMAPADQPEATLEVIKELIGKSKLK